MGDQMTAPTDRLTAIQQREQQATKGPWFAWYASTDFVGWTVQIAAGWLFKASDKCGEHDAGFIAHASEDIPWLVQQVQSLQQALAEAQTCLTAERAKSLDAQE